MQQEIHEILQKYWGYSRFRPLQEEIISSVLNGTDTLALLPTGGGKSICFQVPAMAREGMCLVVSPLIALMKDQVFNLNRRGIRASAIFSGMSSREIDITLDNCIYGNVKFLYVSPERLQTDLFLERLKKMKINLLAIDEAHCISQWGYDFRPPYLKIADIRPLLSDIPVLALTASATNQVQEDIMEKLLFKEKMIFRKSFARENLSYVVLYEEDRMGKLMEIIGKVRGTGIIYARNRRKTREVAELLRHQNVSADFYHAGLSAELRSTKQENWIRGKTRVMVCTNAFGMGIDKPDVRFVVHLDMPGSLEEYYQEAGRAGRDEKRSFVVILNSPNANEKLKNSIEERYPPADFVKKVYSSLCYYCQLAEGSGNGNSYDLVIADFCKHFDLPVAETYFALKVMEEQGLLTFTESVFLAPRLKIIADKFTLYKFEVENRKFEPLIKVILRSYEGVLDNFVKINEQTLARQLNLATGEITQLLLVLQNQGILHYEPLKDKPQVTFLHPRTIPENLALNWQYIQNRKAVYAHKVKAALHYVENKTTCRSKMILEYFDEENPQECGFCDVCQGRHQTSLSREDMKNISGLIKKELEKPLTIKELPKQITFANSNLVIQVLRILIDEGKVLEDKRGKLVWQKD